MAQNELGKDWFLALKRKAEVTPSEFRAQGYPSIPTNRQLYALTTGSMGARSLDDATFQGLAADWPSATPAQWDDCRIASDHKLEAKKK